MIETARTVSLQPFFAIATFQHWMETASGGDNGMGGITVSHAWSGGPVGLTKTPQSWGYVEETLPTSRQMVAERTRKEPEQGTQQRPTPTHSLPFLDLMS